MSRPMIGLVSRLVSPLMSPLMSTERTWRGERSRGRRALLAPLLAGALLTVAAAPPGGPVGEGSQDGRTASVALENSSIVLSGNGLGGNGGGGYRIPRPCWYEPGKSAEEMLQTQEGLSAWWYTTHPGATEEQYKEFIKQYEDKVGQPGKWWSPAYDSADPDGMSCWAGLEGALWVPQGSTPPAGITPEALLQIARAALTVPKPTIRLNPDGKSFVNLETWVWLTGIGATTRSVTATIPGVMSGTVTATLRDGISIRPGTGDADTYKNCGKTGFPYDSADEMKCGVIYRRVPQRGEAYPLSVTTTWDVNGVAGGTSLGFTPVQVTAERDVAVGEVQSTVRR